MLRRNRVLGRVTLGATGGATSANTTAVDWERIARMGAPGILQEQGTQTCGWNAAAQVVNWELPLTATFITPRYLAQFG